MQFSFFEVPCISGEGLRQQVRAIEGSSFQDPYRREDGQLLTIHNDYMRYIVFGTHHLDDDLLEVSKLLHHTF